MTDWRKWLPVLLLVAFAAVIWFAGVPGEPGEQAAGPQVSIAYSEFKSLVGSGAVASLTFSGRQVEGQLKAARALGERQVQTDRFRVTVPELGDPGLLPSLDEAGVRYGASGTGERGWSEILIGLLPWLLFIGVYIWFWRRLSRNMPGGFGGGGEIDRFLSGSATAEADKPATPVTFADVAGQDNAKRDVAELVEFLRNPERFTRLGAEVPHGVLLIGPPGTGKTLLARALAGEAGVPFFSISASEFIEVFVGVGASRVRKMFDEAKKRQPSIIFIDELDAVGRVRGAGLGGGHDEREQTLNQILSEMDGFGGHEAVIVLSATNRPDVLDPALLRPGRFDRHVVLDLPDLDARRQILAVHVRKVPHAPSVDLAAIAAATPGYSGADLKNLVNEAAMAAARDGRDSVTATDFDEMRDRVTMGAPRTLAIQPDERHRLAVHESGHAAVAYLLPNADPLYKVTIIPRGRSLGSTHQLPEAERHTLPEDYLRDRLAVMLAGRAAEKVALDTVSSGADDDIHQATSLARAMVARWGMSSDVGPMDVRDSEEHPFLGREMAQPRRFSEATAEGVDQAVRGLLVEAEARATDAIRSHRPEFDSLVAALEDRETLMLDDVRKLFGPAGGARQPPRRINAV